MKTFFMFITFLGFLLPNSVYGQEDILESVPKGALEAAQRHWKVRVERYAPESLKHEFGLDSKNDALSCELRNPFKVISIDYRNYNDDRNILDCLVSPNGIFNIAYGYGIYNNDTFVGDISVYYDSGSWKFLELAGYGNKPIDDPLGPIFDKYPISSRCKIYRDISHEIFVIKGDSAIVSFKWDAQNRKYSEINPIEYIKKEKARLLGITNDCN